MSTRKKVVISLIATTGVLLMISVLLVSVFAAMNQNISSNIKINFKPSQHVIGYVGATYSYGNYSDNVMTTDGKAANYNNKRISFGYGEDVSNKTLQMQSSDLEDGVLQLGEDVRELYLTFVFENTGYSNFTAYLDISSIKKQNNIKVIYYDNNGNTSLELPKILVKNPVDNPGDSVEVYNIKIQVENSAKDAEFFGLFVWNLIAEEDS